jgi:hypothetical protein
MKACILLTAAILFLVAAYGQDAAWWLSRLNEETARSDAEYNQKLYLDDLKSRALKGNSQAQLELQLFHGKQGADFVAAIEADRKRRQQIDAQNKLAQNPAWRTNEVALVDLVAVKTRALNELHRLERTKGDTNQIEYIKLGIQSLDGRIAALQQRKKQIEGK